MKTKAALVIICLLVLFLNSVLCHMLILVSCVFPPQVLPDVSHLITYVPAQ